MNLKRPNFRKIILCLVEYILQNLEGIKNGDEQPGITIILRRSLTEIFIDRQLSRVLAKS